MVDIKISAVHIVRGKQSKLKNVHLVLPKDAQEQGKHTPGWECNCSSLQSAPGLH